MARWASSVRRAELGRYHNLPKIWLSQLYYEADDNKNKPWKYYPQQIYRFTTDSQNYCAQKLALTNYKNISALQFAGHDNCKLFGRNGAAFSLCLCGQQGCQSLEFTFPPSCITKIKGYKVLSQEHIRISFEGHMLSWLSQVLHVWLQYEG